MSKVTAVRQKGIKRYEIQGVTYTYHRATGKRLPDLSLDHPDMIRAIDEIERAQDIQSKASNIWGGRVHVETTVPGLQEMSPPVEMHTVAFSVAQVIRFVFKARPGDVIYYHHGNLIDEARRDPHVRQKGRYISLCVNYGLLNPRQRSAVEGETHYYATRSEISASGPGMPRNVLDGTITPDEFESLQAIDHRQASVSTRRAIRDAVSITESEACELRNSFIVRGCLTNARPPRDHKPRPCPYGLIWK